MSRQRSVATAKSDLVARLPRACSDEAAAVEFMEEQRWGESPACPKCGVEGECYKMTRAGTTERNARYLWRCRACKQQYTVRVGTIMEDSPIPLRHWCYAFWAACSSKKGVSAKQIERMTGVTYKSALVLMHRVRWAMAPANANEPMLSGDVEADETYVGGKPRKRNPPGATQQRRWKRYEGQPMSKMGPGADFKDRKTPVFASVERGGRVKMRVLAHVTPVSLKAAMAEMIDHTQSRLLTDEASTYKKIGREFARGHDRVNHGAGEYARGDVNTNSMEGVFSLLKRGIHGTSHSVSRKHLHRYVSEFEFRYNARKVDDGERTKLAIQAADGKRLTYRSQVKGEE